VHPLQVYVLGLWANSKTTVTAMTGAGLYPVCFFSAGTAQSALSDYGQFPGGTLGNSPTSGHQFVDVRASQVQLAMYQVRSRGIAPYPLPCL
jgi:hypothetical protein